MEEETIEGAEGEVEEIVEEGIENDLDEAEEAEAMAEMIEDEAETDSETDVGNDGEAEAGVDADVDADADVEGEEADQFLVSRQKYLASGIHIGMKQRTKQMRQFIYKIRPDGLAVMNLRIIDERIRIAAKFLAKTDRIIVVSRRGIAHKAIGKFADIVGATAIQGRFMPGTLTNPNYEEFHEADVVLVVDPMSDYQAVKEGVTARIPIVAVADTFNETNDIDLVVPANNKGAKSIATLFWLLAREILKERGKLASDDEYGHNVADFMKEIERRERDTERNHRGGGRKYRGRGSGRGLQGRSGGSRSGGRSRSRRQ